MVDEKRVALTELGANTTARIVELDKNGLGSDTHQRLLEYGFLNGATISVKHFGPVGADPIAVTCRGALVGIGRSEAKHIFVAVEESK